MIIHKVLAPLLGVDSISKMDHARIASRFDDFVLQKYHIDDMTIYALILTIFRN